MPSLRYVSLAGLALAVVLVVTGSVGYDALSAERDVGVDIVKDDSSKDALLGVDVTPDDDLVFETGQTSQGVVLVTVTNNAKQPLSLTASVTDDDESTAPNVNSQSTPASLGSGASGDVTADVECGDSANTESWTVTIEATATEDGNQELEIELSRTVTITCEEPTTTTGTS
jgi:hypothetical protein